MTAAVPTTTSTYTSTKCPSWFTNRGASCKRRDCPVCGPRWARDWRRVMEANFTAYGAPVVMVAITPPGKDRLPWDEAHCAHRRPHTHTGPRGCRCEQRAAREWTETVTFRWSELRRAAVAYVRRNAPVPVTLLARVWEPQKRGVPHLHVVLGYGTPAEREAAQLFVDYLHERAGDYGFGNVDRGEGRKRKLVPKSGKEAARYLAAYLTGRSKHKPNIRETLVDPAMTRLVGTTRRQNLPLVYVSTKLTRATFVTMRVLRRVRHLWAAARGACEWPKWSDVDECFRVRTVFRRFYGRRAPPPPDLLAGIRELRPFDSEFVTLAAAA